MNRRPGTRRKIGRAHLLFAAAAALTPLRSATANTDQWIGGSSDWNTASNWSPTGVPGASDTVNVTSTLGLSQTITYDYTGAAVALNQLILDLTGGSGGAGEILSMSANSLSTANYEYVGYLGTGTFRQSGGNNTVNLGLLVAENSGSTGTYTLSGSGLLSVTDFEAVGESGTGTFNQSGGVNTISGAGGLQLGYAGTSTGAYTLSGAGTLSSGGSEEVGVSGTGNFNQAGGKNVASALYLGDNTGSSGTYTLSGAGSLSSGYEYVGNAGTGVFNQSGGTNSASGSVDIGYTAGSTGSYTLTGTGSLSVSIFEAVGFNSTGMFNQSGGNNTVNFGLFVGENGGSTGTYTLSGSGSLSATNFEGVGDSGTGTFDQTGGVNTISGLGGLQLGNSSGSKGTYILGGGTATVSDGVYVGGSIDAAGGTGVLTVNNSGHLSVGGTLQVWNTGRVNLDVPVTNVGNLAIAGNGILNLNGALNINYGSAGNDPAATIIAYLQSGYNGGAWTGTSGIISTSVAAGGGPGKPIPSVGYADGNTDKGTPAGANQIVVQYALAGDANLDGRVNSADLLAVIQNFNKTGTDWSQGNFTYITSGQSTTSADLLLIIQNFNQTLPPPAGSAVTIGGDTIPLDASAEDQPTAAQVPEPAASGLMATALAGLLGRRKRRHRCAGAESRVFLSSDLKDA